MMSSVFRPKVYLIPKTEDELSSYLKEYGERVKIISGGTGIYEVAHRGLLSDIEALIDIRELGLSYVKSSNTSVIIGAATSMSSLFRSKEIQRSELASIGDALRAIHPLQVKNVATIAGAICTALPFFDLPVALHCVGARIKIGPRDRIVQIYDFVKGYFAVDLASDEYVREIEIPIGIKLTASAFRKFAVTHDDWALINCGASVSLDESGTISKAVIYFGGGVGERPVRASKIETSLTGSDPREESSIKKILDSGVSKDLEPISDIRASAEYRRRLAAIVGRRTILEAAHRVI